jgi:hypothetical protein
MTYRYDTSHRATLRTVKKRKYHGGALLRFFSVKGDFEPLPVRFERTPDGQVLATHYRYDIDHLPMPGAA